MTAPTNRSARDTALTSSAAAIRQRAQAILSEGIDPSLGPMDSMSIESIRQVIHELSVHQIELELQNDELRRAQVQLANANARYFDLYDLAPVGYCTISATGLILQANLSVATLLGLTRSEMVNRSLFQFIRQTDQDSFYLLRRRLIDTGKTQTDELRMVKKDGIQFWAQLVASVVLDEEGLPTQRIVLTDISVRKQAEEALRLSEAKIRATLEAIPDLMFELGLDGRYYDFYSPRTELLVAPPQDLMATLVADTMPAASAAVVMAALQEANQFGFSNGKQFPLALPQGKKWFELSVSRKAAERGEERFVVLSRDITDRIESQEKLQASEVRYYSVVSALTEAIVTLARDGSVTTWNDAAERLLGLSPEAMPSGRALDPRWRTIHEDGSEFPAEIRPSRTALRTGKPQLNVIMGIYKPNAKLTWVSVNAVPMFDPGDPLPATVVVSFLDITARKAAEAELEQHRQHLEELVAKRTQEIETLNAELTTKARDAEAASRAKGSFLATMSHELRTPLNAVVGLAGLLTDSSMSRRQRDYAEKIKLSAQALRTLIDDILDYSKIEAGELRLEHAPFSLNAILHTAATVIGVSLAHKPLEAFFDLAPDVPDALVGDALRLQQILLNLTSNAVKFTSTGAIVVSVRRAESPPGGEINLRICVRDTGIGIAPDQLSAIFDAFTQADASTSRMYGGTGLGLAISTRLATLMGGRIWVESTLGQGSEFHLEVPLTLGCNLPQTAPEGVPSNLSILIVDDQALGRDILMRTCAGFGWHASAVNSGAEGLQELHRSAAAGEDYDLMLLDWQMPDMNGLEMLRQAYLTPGIGLPLVVLMAPFFELERAVAASDDIELDGIVTKPMLPSSLLEAVEGAYSGDYPSVLPAAAISNVRLAGLRLLVAEDNPLNQEVIEQILTRAGAKVVLVGDGIAAVQTLGLGADHFDAVLMDIQMPLMDGYTATRIIREELGLVDLPIIAITAFAQPEDHEKTRLAGMVGHIVKPLDVEDLLDLLVAERRSIVGQSINQTAFAPRNMSAVSKLPGLDIAAGLATFGGDAKKYADILHRFMLQHGDDIDAAHHQISSHNPEAALHLLHGLSGIAGLLQAHELASLARTAEEALRNGDAQAIQPLLEKLQAAMVSVKASLQQFDAMDAGTRT
ncbi:MAG: response regulator [Rhodoferax sp.]|uniref:PAS domain-containing hybrid sensor histidine kinase/response regulator n=1 Tax=Rhodoferax sp. TaxID=50421 RepID=UPI00260190A6|nr:PAS domain-containing hybrid sensor histidine kinase/response regulator [Rhodoferax sp.]MDD2878832.1 response regulator [Rhodoferax sp.]